MMITFTVYDHINFSNKIEIMKSAPFFFQIILRLSFHIVTHVLQRRNISKIQLKISFV